MKNKSKFFLFLISLFISNSYADPLSQQLSANQIIDLTHPMYEEMAYWPGGVPFKKEKLVGYEQGYLLHKFIVGENTGTHVDAPAHFVRGKRFIDQIPLNDLVVPIVLIDIKLKTSNDADYQLSAEDIMVWEKQNGLIEAGTLVLLNTGWHSRFADPVAYINMDEKGIMHFPGYSATAAKLLVERDVKGIGIDTLSIDPGNSKDFAAHKIMLGANKYQIENLANLDSLLIKGATAVIGVLPVRGGSQAQARIFAFIR